MRVEKTVTPTRNAGSDMHNDQQNWLFDLSRRVERHTFWLVLTSSALWTRPLPYEFAYGIPFRPPSLIVVLIRTLAPSYHFRSSSPHLIASTFPLPTSHFPFPTFSHKDSKLSNRQQTCSNKKPPPINNLVCALSSMFNGVCSPCSQ